MKKSKELDFFMYGRAALEFWRRSRRDEIPRSVRDLATPEAISEKIWPFCLLTPTTYSTAGTINLDRSISRIGG